VVSTATQYAQTDGINHASDTILVSPASDAKSGEYLSLAPGALLLLSVDRSQIGQGDREGDGRCPADHWHLRSGPVRTAVSTELHRPRLLRQRVSGPG
jgi:hypothetical protein